MSVSERFGRELSRFAGRVSYYPLVVQSADRKREERVRAGEDPHRAAMAMAEEVANWDTPYSGPHPRDVLEEIAVARARRDNISYQDALTHIRAINWALAELEEVWTSSPRMVLEALARLGSARWEKINLTDPEAVASLILDEVKDRQARDERYALEHYRKRGWL